MTAERFEELGVELSGSKEELLSLSDFVTIHLILGERSRGLIGTPELELIGPRGYLINTSRGPIVDEAALLEALDVNKICGAVLDVYDIEPLPVDHPLRICKNVVLLPHLGYVSANNYQALYQGAVTNIRTWLDGEVKNKIMSETTPS